MDNVSLYHVQINVSNAKESLLFYKNLFAFLGYHIIDQSPSHLGVSNGTTDFWIIETEKAHQSKGFHRKNTGINHLAFRVSSRSDVDTFVEKFLAPAKISPLYGGPREFPEYDKGYYAVFFEDPDRLKLEVTFKPSSGKK